jgi:hypothetical protein
MPGRALRRVFPWINTTFLSFMAVFPRSRKGAKVGAGENRTHVSHAFLCKLQILKVAKAAKMAQKTY